MRSPHVPRLLTKGLLLVVALGVGLLTAYALPGAISAAGEAATSTTAPSISTATPASSGGAATGSHPGSTWLYVLLLLGLVLLLMIPYFWDLAATLKRQKEFLGNLKTNSEFVTKRELDQVVDRATGGSEGLVRTLITFGVVSIFAAALLYLLIKDPTIKHSKIVGDSMTALVTLLTAIVAFYFGTRSAQTSASSTDSDSATQDEARKKADEARKKEEPPA